MPALKEAQSRKNFLKIAKKAGFFQEAKQIFKYYDGILAKCDNEQEKQLISIEAVTTLHNLISPNSGELIINGIKFK